MSIDYAELVAVATELITEFGASTTLINQSSSYNESTGVATVTSTSHTVTAVVIDDKDSFEDGTIRVGQRKAYVDSSFAPKTGDLLVWLGKNIPIVNTKPLAPGGVIILYELTLQI